MYYSGYAHTEQGRYIPMATAVSVPAIHVDLASIQPSIPPSHGIYEKKSGDGR